MYTIVFYDGDTIVQKIENVLDIKIDGDNLEFATLNEGLQTIGGVSKEYIILEFSPTGSTLTSETLSQDIKSTFKSDEEKLKDKVASLELQLSETQAVIDFLLDL